ncbi:GerAB/ArcD/ProY family transporter [Anaerobacillus sp. HL2]|nr:GerAB/ArcD/ProY family transporter [Anaerobacillus sp. HL2]
MSEKDYSKLLPIMENGIQPLLPVILLIIAVFGEMIVLLMVNVRRDTNKVIGYRMIFIILFIVNLIIFPSTAAGPIAIFGEALSQQLTYPVESTVRLVNIGFIIDFDIYDCDYDRFCFFYDLRYSITALVWRCHNG